MIAPEQLLDIVANLERSNQRPAAVAVLRNVLRDRPGDVRALVLMAELALKENHCEAALALLGKALAVAADDEPARRLLHATALEQGPVLLDEGRNEDAAAVCAQAEEAGIPDPRLVHNRGLALQRLERLDEATQAFRRALAISPNLPDTAFQLGKCLYLRGLAESAAISLRRSLILSPEDPDSWLTLGSVLESQADFAEAETACRRAIRVEASHALAHMRLGQALARRGLLAEGFAAMEWRHRLAGAHHPPALFPQPQWDGGEFPGKTLLLLGEYRFGDVLHFLRYATLAARRGGRVVVEVPRELVALARSLPGVAEVVARGCPLPPFDLWLPLMSCVRVLGTILDGIPAEIPYVGADPDRVAVWRARLGPATGRRVGLVWGGNANHPFDRRRSLPLSACVSLAAVPGIEWHSLQVGPPAAQRHALAAPWPMVDHTAGFTDFAETAAYLHCLDLVVTVDTSMAHLAGALGRPVWVLSRADSCWRWLLTREDSPWYPTLRLLRQERPRDWAGLVARLVRELRAWVTA